MTETTELLIKNIGQLATLAPLAARSHYSGIENYDLGTLSNAWLYCRDGVICDYGEGPPPDGLQLIPYIDAAHGLVLPGLIDCHTHPIFAGNRANEFAMRLNGASYQEIAAAGGGIRATMNATRQASEDDLRDGTLTRLRRFLHWGVTTVEVKSGYGLSVASELSLLRALNAAQGATAQTLSITCLALHAIPPEFATARLFAEDMAAKLLPIVAKERLASSVDAFIEQGYFSAADTEPYFRSAKALGLSIRVHADEFSDSAGAQSAARWGALSADHLQHASLDGIQQMAAAGVVAVLLPGTSLYTAIPFTKAKAFREAGCAIAVATDFNPGSCVVDNLPLAATLAAVHAGLNVAEAIAAVTWVPAYALRLHQSKGCLARGFDADFLIYKDTANVEQWVADLGRTAPDRVFIRGLEQSA